MTHREGLTILANGAGLGALPVHTRRALQTSRALASFHFVFLSKVQKLRKAKIVFLMFIFIKLIKY